MWDSGLAGADLLMALAIADHADHEGRCWPGIELLMRKTKLGKRQVQRIIHSLSEKGIFKIVTGSGRGHKTIFEFQKVTQRTPLPETETVTPATPFNPNKGDTDDTLYGQEKVTFPTLKGDISSTEKVTFPVSHIEEESLRESLREPAERQSPAPGSDDRKDHPAIRKIREVAKLFPPKPIWDRLIAALGDNPDSAKLRDCFETWVGRGYSPTNYDWALEWYRDGVPRFGRYASAPNRNGHRPPDPGRTSDECAQSPVLIPKPQRPPATIPIEQTHVWNAFRDELAKHMAPDPFATWFKPLIFDGFNGSRNALKVRTVRITHDWIRSYYSELIYDSLIAIGLGEFTLEWEIEEEEFEEIETV